MALQGIDTVVRVSASDELTIDGCVDERVVELTEKIVRHYRVPRSFKLEILERIPSHAGLGSGTQLALAIGTAITGFFGCDASVDDLSTVLARGKRSGIGLHLFAHGGLIVDAGHSESTTTPTMIARYPVPGNWRVVLIFDREHQGLSGADEIAAFRALPPLSREQAAQLCHLTLLRLMPAIVEQDFAVFAGAIGEMQAIVGDHFAPVQGGRYSSPAVAQAIALCEREHGLTGLGQSSWGPTAFAFVPDQRSAEQLIATLEATRAHHPGIEFKCYAARNCGVRERIAMRPPAEISSRS